MIRLLTSLFLLLLTAEVRSETVDVKYRGPVDLKTFECRDINRSSFISVSDHLGIVASSDRKNVRRLRD
jgi:hypothetical protein